MMKTRLLLLLLALALAVALVACDEDGGGDSTPATGTVSGAGQTPGPTATLPPDVCQPNPSPATIEFQVLEEPSGGVSVSSPVTISGQVLYFENSYLVTIYDTEGEVIVETFGTAGAADIGELAPFTIDVPFAVDQPTPACIWVYEASARDGSPVHVGQIPVLLLP